MTASEEPVPEVVAAEVAADGPADGMADGTADRSRLPVPVAATTPGRREARLPGLVAARLGGAVERIRPMWPALMRGAAVTASVSVGALVAAKVGPRVLGRSASSALPALPARPGLPVVPRPPAGLLSPASRDALTNGLDRPPDIVMVTRMFVSWSRVEVYRGDRP